MTLSTNKTFVGNIHRVGGGLNGLDTPDLLFSRWDIIARRGKKMIFEVSSGYPFYAPPGVFFPPDDISAKAYTHITLPRSIKSGSSIYGYISFFQNFDAPLPFFGGRFKYLFNNTFTFAGRYTWSGIYPWTGEPFIQIVPFDPVLFTNCVADATIEANFYRGVGLPAQDVLVHEIGFYYEVDKKGDSSRPY